MSRYLFKQTTFEKEIAGVTEELKAAIEEVRDWVSRKKARDSTPDLTTDILERACDKLFTNNMRSANYILSSKQTSVPQTEDYDNIPEVDQMEDDVKISCFHHWCRPSAEENQLLPLMRLLDEFLPTLQECDSNTALNGGKDVALFLAQLLWQATHLALWLLLPENQDIDWVKECVEYVAEAVLMDDDKYEGSLPPTMDQLFALIKVDFNVGWDYLRVEILRRQVLFPLANPEDKNALFRHPVHFNSPNRNPPRNLFSLIFDYQLIAPWTSQKDMATHSEKLMDLDPETKFHQSLQHFLKAFICLFANATNNQPCTAAVVHGAGLLVQLQNHWNKVVERFKFKEELLQIDFTSASRRESSLAAAAEYKTKLEEFIEDKKPFDLSSLLSELEGEKEEPEKSDSDDSDEEEVIPANETNFELISAASSCHQHLSQVAFCILILTSFSDSINSYIIRPDGSLSDVGKKASRSNTQNLYPTNLKSTLPDYDGVAKGRIDVDELRRWSSPEDDLDEVFWLYPEQDRYYADLYIYQVVTYTKLALVLYKSLDLNPGNRDWYWKAYTTASIVNTSYTGDKRTGDTLFNAIDILFAAVIRVGGFVANRVLFNLLFDEDRMTEIKPVLIGHNNNPTDEELHAIMTSTPKVNPTHFAMPSVLPLPTDEFDLIIGLADDQLPDDEVLSKHELMKRHLALVQDKVAFSHSFIDIILQHHIQDTTTHYFVTKHDHNIFSNRVVNADEPLGLVFPAPSLIAFISSIFFGAANQVVFTYEKRYRALYRYLLLEQRLGLLMEQAMLTFSDMTPMNLMDQGAKTNTPDWTDSTHGYNGSITGVSFILAVFAQGLDAYRHSNYDKCGPDGNSHPSLRSWTDPLTVQQLPMQINTLSHSVEEWKLATTARQTKYREGEFVQNLNKTDPETNYNPVFSHKFINSYNILTKEQLALAYKSHYEVQMDLFHRTNIWPIFGYLMQQQYHLRNMFLIKSREVKRVFQECRLTGIPIPIEKENLGNSIYWNGDDLLPDAREAEEESEAETDTDEDDTDVIKEPKKKYEFTGLPKTRCYNWLYVLGQMKRHDDLPHEQSSIYVMDGMGSEQAKAYSFESPAVLAQANQILFNRRVVSDGEVDDTTLATILTKTLSGYVKHISDMIRTGVARDVVQPHFDLIKSFLVTNNHHNFARQYLYRLLQIASVNGWSTADEPLMELIAEWDYTYKLIMKEEGLDKETFTATVFQRTEFLSAVVQGACNLSFAAPYGKPEDAWAHYYPKVDIETGEETLNSSFEDSDIKNDGPWDTWQDLRKLNILGLRCDYFDNDNYNDLSKAINLEYPLFRLIGRLKEHHKSQLEEWKEELRQDVSTLFLLQHSLLTDKPPKKKKYSWESESDSDEEEEKDNQELLRLAVSLVPLATQSPAFMTQFAIEQFIDMMLQSNTNPALSTALDTIDLKLKMAQDVVDAPWTLVTAANGMEALGNPFPLGSKMLVPAQQIHFGFAQSAGNPLNTPAFQPSVIVSPVELKTTGLPVYSEDEQLKKLNKLSASLRAHLDQKL